jgi:hypothetical protein
MLSKSLMSGEGRAGNSRVVEELLGKRLHFH